MVESAAGDRGAEEGRPPYADVPEKREDMDELHPQAASPHKTRHGSTGKERWHDRAVLRPSTGDPCEEARPDCPSQASVTKLPNGNVNCFSTCDESTSPLCCSSRKYSRAVVNGELFSDSDGAAQCVDALSAVPSTSSVSCTSDAQPVQTTSDVGVAIQQQDKDEIRTSSSVHGSHPLLYSPAQREASSGGQESGIASIDCSAQADLTPRPHFFWSLSQSPSLGSDPTPLSPEGQECCSDPHGQHDLTFMDVSLISRNTYEINRRQSAPDNIPGVLSVAVPDLALGQKKNGLSEIFGRGLFSRRQREAHSAPGWKLFGKVPPRESTPKDSRTIQQEYEAKTSKAGHSPPQPTSGRRKNLQFEPLSTTALILEERPANLPAKPEEEAQRHRQEYNEMVAEAKKRELKEAQKKKQQMKERFRQEESIASAMVVWNTEILPNWDSMRSTRKVKDLWWQGLPPNVRGRVWSLAIGNDLNITAELYEIFLSRAKERWKTFREVGCEAEAEDSGASMADRESSLDLIKLDISRTFPSLYIFQKGGPYHDLLHSVLGAYTCYRPDVGYVQGMSFIAAVLILNLEEADAFIAFANLLNKPCQMAFFRVDHELMLKYFAAFEVFFEENLPRLFSHFKSSGLTPDLYLIDWIFTLYSKSLPLDVACRVWDVFCRDGEEFLFRTGLGMLRLYEDTLLCMDFIHVAQFLTRLPDDVSAERLFASIACTQMTSGNRKWSQVFSALMKDKEMDKSGSPCLKSS
ncbi:TBC1 domain family member 12 isoform X2 [Electrophorus electricus]|uniref:Rab-GAP TBC domain-containing protein n=1 Tax=Electrophorus electricus TaxID=8005 RepID=A0A4W4GQG1_ELEEL|nr:TBC1 domain family member 12 isoform X2 [Electrophorus electricus]